MQNDDLYRLEAGMRALADRLTALEQRRPLPHARTHEQGGADELHYVVQEGGVNLTRRKILNFAGGITATDNPANNRTDITVP